MASTWMSTRREHDPTFLMKFVVRIITVVCVFAAAISASVTSGDQWWINIYQPIFIGAWVLSVLLIFTWFGVAIVRQRPIHPAFSISSDLALCLWYIVGTTLGAFYIPGNGYKNRIGVLPALVLTFLCAVFHCWTFIISCVEEDRRRKAVKAGQPDPTRNPSVPPPCYNHAACVGCKAPVEPYCANCHAVHVANLQAYNATAAVEAGRPSEESIVREKNSAAAGITNRDAK